MVLASSSCQTIAKLSGPTELYNVASSENGAPHWSCCSLTTRMSRRATGKKSPGEPSANGDRERNPSKQFRDCFLRSRHSATIYPEQFPEQRIVDRAQGPIAPPRPRRRGCRWWRPPARRPPRPCPPAIQQRVRQRHPLAGWPAHTTGLSIHGPHCSLGCYLGFQAHATHQFNLLR